MSPTNKASREQPVPASADFTFPDNSHLLITCPRRILSWDTGGVHTIFRSSKAGIVAAREAKDGSGILAIADKQVVVLHDTKRGQEKSWGLEAEQDEVRHMEYTADAKSLFLSTNLTTDIQRYSTERSRLLDPTNIHASPPVALAVSPTGHAMVSASDHPPTVYLKNLTHNSSPTLIEPRLSKAAVSVIAFHPQRANIFLLAFRDGSLAAYDSTRIGRNQGGQFADQRAVNHGQIAGFAKLHRATTETSKLASITGAAFVPGFKTRAITVGNDGRCRIVDFAGKGEIIRTWHAKAPVTSVSVLSLKQDQSVKSPFVRNRASHTIGGPTSIEGVIATGRADGVVHLYDFEGLLLDHRSLGIDDERIISLEWTKGPSPRAIAESVIASQANKLLSVTLKTALNGPRAMENVSAMHLSANIQHNSPVNAPARRFTIHPDELEDGTVRHTPMPGNAQAPPAVGGAYIDLFSPMKPAAVDTETNEKKRVSSPPRSRPRISTQTFVKSPEPAPAAENDRIAKPRNIALFPSTDSTDDTISPMDHHMAFRTADVAKPPPSCGKQRLTWEPSDRRRSRRSVESKPLPTQPSSNAKVLADLRKMSTARAREQAGGVLAAFKTASKSQQSTKGKPAARKSFHRQTGTLDTDLESSEALREFDSARREMKWIEDSEQGDAFGGDIWLTSESDKDTQRRPRRRRSAGTTERPPARQTSRTRVTSKGTMSTAANLPSSDPVHLPGRLDGSTEDEDMHTARSQFSPSGTFSPSSKDISHLFPRSSSLSPHKRTRQRRASPLKSSYRMKDPRTAERRTLREVTLNTAHTRQVKSPWEKVRAGKVSAATGVAGTKALPVEVFEDPACAAGAENEGFEMHCAVCGPTKIKVAGLETEVARLRGEVLALKAVLRRNGLQAPAGR